jgi:hypothetical protein
MFHVIIDINSLLSLFTILYIKGSQLFQLRNKLACSVPGNTLHLSRTEMNINTHINHNIIIEYAAFLHNKAQWAVCLWFHWDVLFMLYNVQLVLFWAHNCYCDPLD